jgi:membrane protein implicated in regulation of membrane protease activity
VGASLVCLYAAQLAAAGRSPSWWLLAAAAAATALLLVLYLRRFRQTHRTPSGPPGP